MGKIKVGDKVINGGGTGEKGIVRHIGKLGTFGDKDSVWSDWDSDWDGELVAYSEGGDLTYSRNPIMIKPKVESLRDEINALEGWTKEADDILKKLYDNTDKRLVVDSYGDCGSVSIITHGGDMKEIMKGERGNAKLISTFRFHDQCSKNQAFIDALLYMLNESGLEGHKKGDTISIESEGRTYKVKIIKEM